MSDNILNHVKEVKELNRQLTVLLDDPQPGLFTWNDAMFKTLAKIAGFVDVERDIKKGITLTHDEFISLIENIERHAIVKRHTESSGFLRRISVNNGTFVFELEWFLNSVSVSFNETVIYFEFPVSKIEISNTWPNNSKMNLQISKDDTYLAIPLTYYKRDN